MFKAQMSIYMAYILVYIVSNLDQTGKKKHKFKERKGCLCVVFVQHLTSLVIL